MDFSPDGKWIVTVPVSNSLSSRVWDASTGQQVKTLDETAGQSFPVEFSPDSQLLFISIYTDLEVIDKISAWDVNTWQKLGVLTSYSENSRPVF